MDDTQWTKTFGEVRSHQVEDWGLVQVLRVYYENGIEVEYGLTTSEWIKLNPIDEGTLKVVTNGAKILFDPKGILSALCYKVSKITGSLSPKKDPRIEIPAELVKELIQEQFPQWGHLPISQVKTAGWCNGAHRLGSNLVVKLPRAERYEKSHLIDNKWLPVLSRELSIAIPRPVALGVPSGNYLWHWSVYEWIEGETVGTLPSDMMSSLPSDLAEFLKELHCANAADGPRCWDQSFYRGAPLLVYDEETRSAVSELQNFLNVPAVLEIWEQALLSTWNNAPVWVHGDIFPANILIKDNKLNAVIDFGNVCVGDPACDLVIAWTFFRGESRELFKSKIEMDSKTWQRARGWALWKALIVLAGMEDKASIEAASRFEVITTLLEEDRADN